MSVVTTGSWYTEALAAVRVQKAGVTHHLGRPWADHFERVALRLIFRNQVATRHQIQAALLHDVFMERGGGWDRLHRLGVSCRAVGIIERTTPPPDADYFRDLDLIGPAKTAIDLAYIWALAASGDREAVEMKSADIADTIDACRQGATDLLTKEYRTRYEPSCVLLDRALSR